MSKLNGHPVLNAYDDESIEELERVILVPRTKIRPMPGQPREFFDPQEMEELVESIREFGQQTPRNCHGIKGEE